MTVPRLSYDERLALLIDQYPGLTRISAMLLLVLTDAQGRIVPRARLAEEIEEMLGRDLEDLSLTAVAKRLRPIIAPHGLKVQGVYGIGYRLTQTPERI